MSRSRKYSKDDRVVRIRRNLHARLTDLAEAAGNKCTLNEVLERVLDTAEQVITGKVKYATKLFDDLADARGEAIIHAVKTKSIPEMPQIVVVVGEDAQL